jgi:GNAT superfamily N-acetyltransferase
MEHKQININNLELVTRYSLNDRLREKLYPLFQKVFGIETKTLTDFYQRGFWSDHYFPYTFFDGEQAVANVSAFPLDMMINGEYKRCAGIQSVMTDPDYRGNGLMKVLFSKMLGDIDKEFEGALLFTSSPELYTPFGFNVINQHFFKKDYNQHSLKKNPSIRKLEPFNEPDLEILYGILKNKEPLSKVFALLAYEHPLYFNLYNPWLYEKFFFIEELNTILVFEVKAETLRIFDMISAAIPPLDELCSYIPFHFNVIEFYFNPEVFKLTDIKEIEYKTENKLMVRGPFPLEKQLFMMPLTAEF